MREQGTGMGATGTRAYSDNGDIGAMPRKQTEASGGGRGGTTIGQQTTIRMLLKECLEMQENIYHELQEHFDKDASSQKLDAIPTPINPNELDEIAGLLRELQSGQNAVQLLLSDSVYPKL